MEKVASVAVEVLSRWRDTRRCFILDWNLKLTILNVTTKLWMHSVLDSLQNSHQPKMHGNIRLIFGKYDGIGR